MAKRTSEEISLEIFKLNMQLGKECQAVANTWAAIGKEVFEGKKVCKAEGGKIEDWLKGLPFGKSQANKFEQIFKLQSKQPDTFHETVKEMHAEGALTIDKLALKLKEEDREAAEKARKEAEVKAEEAKEATEKAQQERTQEAWEEAKQAKEEAKEAEEKAEDAEGKAEYRDAAKTVKIKEEIWNRLNLLDTKDQVAIAETILQRVGKTK